MFWFSQEILKIFCLVSEKEKDSKFCCCSNWKIEPAGESDMMFFQ